MKYGLYCTGLLILGSCLLYGAVGQDESLAATFVYPEAELNQETSQPFTSSEEDLFGKVEPVSEESQESQLLDETSMIDERSPEVVSEALPESFNVYDQVAQDSGAVSEQPVIIAPKKSEFVEHLEDTYKVNLLKNKLEYLTSKLEVIQKNTLDLFEHIATKESIDVNNSTNTKKYYHKKIALLRQAVKAQKALFKSYLPELEAAFAQS
ncbi:hypothetical protein KBD08_03810 [Candidatus Babeliales bacterium]|nr:hypothetical protein [Candidatus Babeliales bacterium]